MPHSGKQLAVSVYHPAHIHTIRLLGVSLGFLKAEVTQAAHVTDTTNC